MPADLLKLYKRLSLAKVKSFKNMEKLEENGERLFSTRCLSLIKDFSCRPFYCSKDEKKLLVEHDYEDCAEAEQW